MPLFLQSFVALGAVLGCAEAKTKARTNPVEEALLALDTDHSGKVERAEIEAFAQSRGLTLRQIKDEFASIDTNGNGELDASEIQAAIASGADSSSSNASPQAATETPSVQQTVELPETEMPAHSLPSAAIQQTANQPATVMPAHSLQSAAIQQTVELPATVMPAYFLQPAAVQVKNEPEIHTLDLEATAEAHAEHVVAQLFEQKAASALTAMREDAKKAQILQETARSLRGQADEVRQRLVQETANAAKTATDTVLGKAARQVKMMESEISSAEQKASEYQKLSKEAMNSAIVAQSQISAEIQRIKSSQQTPL
eukprot:TRINITY_DN1647_c0_g1_i2.p1 TRINITY_DN1647_c0_g1~~TRINITY_DN1647_c0_g1_i2.p1  ORF type:complete len:314 (-),score=87.21 TRINITY_DN1647_c0_g1_i2:59-1000(-)